MEHQKRKLGPEGVRTFIARKKIIPRSDWLRVFRVGTTITVSHHVLNWCAYVGAISMGTNESFRDVAIFCHKTAESLRQVEAARLAAGRPA